MPFFAENGVDLQALICSAPEFVVEPAGVLASSSASSELIEPGFSASSSSSHVDVLQGHPSGVEPAGSSSSVAAPHLTT